jgi:nucleoside-triphosphatase THEP1
MDYKIKDLEEMIIISSDGQSREEALRKLEEYLEQSNIASQGFYFIEAYSGGKVVGAMALAKVDTEPERNKKFRSSTLKPGQYLVFDYPYEKYVEDNMPGADNKLDVKGYLKEKGYRVGGFPFFEFLEETDNKTIRIYVPIN